MADFRRLPPHELERLADGGLVDYLDAARTAGDALAQKEAIGYLAWAFEPMIRARVRSAVPVEDHDDVLMEVMHSLARAAFEGKLIGQFGAFVKTITQRRIADFYRDRERTLEADPLADDHEGDDEVRGGRAKVEDGTGAVDLLDVIERVLKTRNPLHQKVIRLYGGGVDGFEDLPADEVCDRIAADGSGETVTVDNVAKIWSRFKSDLREQLDG